MLTLRHSLTILFFFALCAYCTAVSYFYTYHEDDGLKDEEKEAAVVESYFKRADYYFVNKKLESFHLFSDELIHNQSKNELILTGPNGVVLSKDDKPIYYKSESGYFDIAKRVLNLNKSVVVRAPNMTISADYLSYSDANKIISTSGNVFSKTVNYDDFFELKITSNQLDYEYIKNKVTYQSLVDGRVERFRKYEPPVLFNANRLTLNLVSKTGQMSGEVQIRNQGLTASSREGEIFLENYNKKLKYFALSDDVIVREKVFPKHGEPFERRAYSEKLEGHVLESMVVLLGSPKVYQKKDVLKGNMIILRQNNETIEVDDANTNFRLR